MQPKTRLRIVEADCGRAIAVSEQLSNTIVMHGSVLDQKILMQSDTQDADLIMTLTNNDQTNILAAVMAKQFGCKSNLALLDSSSFHDVASLLDLDAYIHSRVGTTPAFSSMCAKAASSRSMPFSAARRK